MMMPPLLLDHCFPLEVVLSFVDVKGLRAFELVCTEAHAAVTEAVRARILEILPSNQRALLKQDVHWREMFKSLHAVKPRLEWCNAPELDRPRFAHSTVVYKDHVVVFGGRHGPEYLNDVATLSLKTMQWLPDASHGQRPSPKRAHTAVVSEGHMYVLGGGSDSIPGTGEMHSLDLELLTWRQLSQPEDWNYLGHTCVATADRRLVVFGGCWWGCEFKVTDELLQYSTESDEWSKPKASGSLPCARYRHSMAPIPSGDGNTFVLYGGYVSTWRDGCPRLSGEWCYNRADMYTLDATNFSWTRLKLDGPEPLPRGAHSCVALGSHRLLFFGGGILYFDGQEHMEADCDEVFAVDTRTWTFEALEPAAAKGSSEVPSARGSHGAVVAACEGKMGVLVLGGRDYNRAGEGEREVHRGRSDCWLLSCDSTLIDNVPTRPEGSAPAGS